MHGPPSIGPLPSFCPPPSSYGPGPEHGGDMDAVEALQSVQLASGSGGVTLGGGPKTTERQGLINMMADSSQGRW